LNSEAPARPAQRPGIWDAHVITIDVDWAPDFIIDWLSGFLVSRNIPATWFITHVSPAVARLRAHGELFELGIHPNFIQPSTHGVDSGEIITNCIAMVPDAVSMRTHSLFQSTRLFAEILERTDVRVDASLWLPGLPFLGPIEFAWHGRTLLRVPFFWEDDLEMAAGRSDWRFRDTPRMPSGLKVFDFHPIHLFLNSATMDSYEDLKRSVPNIASASPADVHPHVNRGVGAMTFFSDLTERLAAGATAATLRDVYLAWSAERPELRGAR
jgi:hypothetical protein